jgi:uncharacterized protein YbaP (TraB family)
MKKRYSAVLSAFIIFSLFSSAYAGAEAPGKQKHFLWKVRAGAGTVYLLGSLHYLRKDIYPLDSVIEEAFLGSNVLAVEANIDDLSSVDVQKLLGSAMYTGDDTLEKHVSGETYAQLKKELSEDGIPLELIGRQKPWFLALTLTSLELLKSGFDPTYGIDIHFLSEAEGKKKIVELESVAYQIDLLSSFSDTDQESFLLYTPQDLCLIKKESDELLKAWRSGDTKMMESLVFKDGAGAKQISAIYEKLLYERNRNMSSRIEDFLRTKDSYFVVVGAGHLIGNRGIVETLRRKGYVVEQW